MPKKPNTADLRHLTAEQELRPWEIVAAEFNARNPSEKPVTRSGAQFIGTKALDKIRQAFTAASTEAHCPNP